jgi:hypothetical protein
MTPATRTLWVKGPKRLLGHTNKYEYQRSRQYKGKALRRYQDRSGSRDAVKERIDVSIAHRAARARMGAAVVAWTTDLEP